MIRPIRDVLLLLALYANFACYYVIAQSQTASNSSSTTVTRVIGTETQQSMQRRTFITVEYDYRLEVNTTGDNSSNYALEKALTDIDSNIIATLQERLPNGDIREGKRLPNVKFNTINSRVINMCYTESDVCKWVKSRIRVSYAGVKPEHSVERVTLALVQEYLQDINNSGLSYTTDSDPMVHTMYAYPIYFSSVGKFQLLSVKGPMSDTDIEFFEETFYEVFNAISFSLDGDTEVTDAHYVYQSLTDILPGQDGGNIIMTYSLSTNLKYFGKCRYCDEAQFVEIVDGLIESNLDAFLKSLQEGTSSNYDNVTYFQDVEEIYYSLPDLPDGLPPIEDESIFDMKAPMGSNPLPWYLYLGIIISVCLIITGGLVIIQDQNRLKKEEVSTGGESSEDDESDNSDEIIETNASILADDTVVSKGQSVNSNGMHSNYEVYVY